MLTTDFRNHERGSSERVKHRSRRGAKTFIAGATTAALTISGGMLLATPASADPGYSQATAQYLSGSLLGQSLANVANIEGSTAEAQYNDSESTVQANNLNLSVLGGTVLLNAPNGLQVPLSVADAGVIGQYAQANPDGSSFAASGLVANDGTVGVGPDSTQPPGPLRFNLSNILGSGVASDLANLSIEAGASTATATLSSPGDPAGTYNIADAKIVFTSNAVSRIQDVVNSSIVPLQDEVNAVNGSDSPILQDLLSAVGGNGVVTSSNVTLNVDLQGAVTGVLQNNQLLGEGGPVTINLANGVVTVDLEALLAADGQNLNSLPDNTELLSSEIVTLIQNQVDTLMGTLLTQVNDAVGNALDNAVLNAEVTIENPLNLGLPVAQVSLNGTLIDISTGVVQADVTVGDAVVLNATLNNVASRLVSLQVPIGDIFSATTDTLAPTLDELGTLVSLTANAQDTTDGVFTETALRLRLLQTDDGNGNALQLNLARASVGPNALGPNPNNPVTTISNFTPTSGPEAGGTVVTINGFGFTGATGVNFGTTPATNVTVISDNVIFATSPAGEGAVPLTVTGTALGDATSDEQFLYIPEDVTGITDFTPTTGPEAGGTQVTIIGGGFTGADGVNFGSTPATDVTVISDNEIVATSPAGTGSVQITIVGTDNGDLTSDESFTYVPAVVPGAVVSFAPNNGPEAGGTVVTINGSGFTGATGVNFGATPATDVTVISDNVITATTPAGTGKVTVSVLGTATGDLVSTELFIYNPDNGNGGTPTNPGDGGGNGGTPNPGDGGSDGGTPTNPGDGTDNGGNTGGTDNGGDGTNNGGTPNDNGGITGGNGGTPNGTDGEVYYENCAAAQAAGVGPLNISDPGYRAALDGDGDGIACEENTAVARTGSDNPFPLWFGLAGIVLVGAGVFFVTRKATPKTK